VPTARFRRGGTEGRDEGEGLRGAEGITFDRLQDGVLMLVAQCTQGVGQGWTDGSAVHAALDRRRKAGGESVAARDPGLTSPEQVCHSRQAEVVVLVKRADDARLIHRSGRARRRIGAQQEQLDLRRRTNPLHDGGDCRVSGVAPARQALEAIDDFERAVLLRHDRIGSSASSVERGHEVRLRNEARLVRRRGMGN
jgi:hypothetical protein